MRLVVALDVSLELIAVCVMNPDGAVVWQGKVESEPGRLTERRRPWSAEIDIARLEACPQANPPERARAETAFHTVRIESRHAQRFLSTTPPLAAVVERLLRLLASVSEERRGSRGRSHVPPCATRSACC